MSVCIGTALVISRPNCRVTAPYWPTENDARGIRSFGNSVSNTQDEELGSSHSTTGRFSSSLLFRHYEERFARLNDDRLGQVNPAAFAYRFECQQFDALAGAGIDPKYLHPAARLHAL